MRLNRFSILSLLCLLITVVPLTAFAQDLTPADIVDDEGGVQIVTGEFAYTIPDLADYGTQPLIFLGDISEVFGGEFVFSTEYLNVDSPQFLGTITSDIRQSPFTFEVRLPIAPGGMLADVDNDGEEDAGISFYNINFSFNGIDDSVIDNREFIYFRSTTQSLDFETLYKINGGRALIWAPDEAQGFPVGFGEDGELFTADDPTVGIPAGWTVVDLSEEPFTFIRSIEAAVDIVESPGEELPDFSDLGYVDAFTALLDMMEKEYAFTEFKNIDWDAIRATYMPAMEAAEADNDSEAYQLVLADFADNAIPDGHIGIGSQFLASRGLSPTIIGGVGIAIVELSDGRFIANYVGVDTPAAEAGIEVGAEITTLNGDALGEALEGLAGLNPPYSSPTLRRLEQVRQVMRFSVGDEVEIAYLNPGDSDETTAELTAIEESASRLVSRASVYGTPRNSNLPLEYEILDTGYGYVAIYSFTDDILVSILLWQRALALFNQAGVSGIIIDMRYNNGGSPDISEPMLGYLFEEPTYTGTSAFYFEDLDAFATDDLYNQTITPAPNPADRYLGPIAVLISPACFSNCEFFSYALTLRDNVEIVGYYPTGGLGGGIQQFAMPDGVGGQFTRARALGADNEIHIEDTGVAPTLVVPVTEETVFSDGDPLLEAAVEWLDNTGAAPLVDGGAIAIGDVLDGALALGERVFYTFVAETDTTLTIALGDEEGTFDTVVRVYDGNEELIAENDDSPVGGTVNSLIEGLEVAAGDSVFIEVGSYDDAGEGAYTLTITDGA